MCWVRFISKEPNKLPWNTSKTALRVDSSLFLTVRDRLKPIADRYRAEIKNRYPSKTTSTGGPSLATVKNPAQATSAGTVTPSPTQVTAPSTTASAKPKVKKPKLRPLESLHRDREILVDWNVCTVSVPKARKKEYAIFFELCKLNSKDTPIVCAVMLRVFIETTIKQISPLIGGTGKNPGEKSLDVAQKLYQFGYYDHVVKDLISKYSTTEGGLFSINNIQSHVHSTRFHPSQPVVNTYWTELEPFLSACWKYITEQDINKKQNATELAGS